MSDSPVTAQGDAEALAEALLDAIDGVPRAAGPRTRAERFLASDWLAARDAAQRAEAWDEGVTAALNRHPNDRRNPYRAAAPTDTHGGGE